MAKRDPIPEWLLERIAVGEIPEAHRDTVGAHLAVVGDGDSDSDSNSPAGDMAGDNDSDLARRLAELKQSNRDILAALPAEEVAREVARRHRVALAARPSADSLSERLSRSRSWLLGGGAMAGVAVAAVLFLFVLPQPGSIGAGDAGVSADAGEEGIRLKGDPGLVIYRKRGDTTEQLKRGEAARSGDLIRLAYVPNQARHGVIVSVDGSGVITLHFPDTPDGSTELATGGTVALDHAYELDDAPDFERFFFVTGDGPLDVEQVLDSASELVTLANREPQRVRTERLALPDNFKQWTFLLPKEPN
ncbi:MAG: ActD protein [Myxococcota bacterium]